MHPAIQHAETEVTDTSKPAPLLKEIFNRDRLRHIADEMTALTASFDGSLFLEQTQDGLDALSLMQRLRRVAEALHAALRLDYPEALDVLRSLAPRLNSGFVTLALPEFVAKFGQDEFERSMEALAFFTRFGSSEFAVRHFLQRDFARTLAVMEQWSQDGDEHVRRLASEGSRPRLPWSFRLAPLVADPKRTAAILDRLKDDPSLYVRKSVANHLNDITKDHPAYVLDSLEGWPLDQPGTAWVARHALRTLIKKGDKRALAITGAGKPAEVSVQAFKVTPAAIDLGGTVTISATLESTSATAQKLVVDYTIHYVKQTSAISAKVFKLKTLVLEPGQSVDLMHRRSIRDFTTRRHYAGRHAIDLTINGDIRANGFFDLR
jgi:3-methyladenine DNA glycosylase AlkC